MATKKTVSMGLDEFIEEHERLIAVLKKGDRKELSAETKKQEAELKQYKKPVAKAAEPTLIFVGR